MVRRVWTQLARKYPELFVSTFRQAVILLGLLGLAAVASAAPSVQSVILGGHRFTVEIAATPAARQRGLMYRRHLAPDHGMWFVFQDDALRVFWMKNTLIALDILFFDSSRHLVSMQLNVPPCHHDPCPLYSSQQSARYALEVPAGTARRIGIKLGSVFKKGRDGNL